MKNVPVMLEGSFLGLRNERFGDNTSTMAVFLIAMESVPMFVPGNMEEAVKAYPEMQKGIIKANVTFRDQKPGGYFALKDFVYDTPPAKAGK